MTLRPIAPSDCDALSALHGRAFAPGWSADDIVGMCREPVGFGLAIYAVEPLGMILCRTIADETEVLTLAVDPQARRRGVAHALVRAAIELARNRGSVSLFLEVARDNDAAISLYSRAGFEEVGIRRGYYLRSAGAVDALVMRRDLNIAAV